MNRIQNLAEQAGFNPYNYEGANAALFKKFAELIAEECASMCMSQADRKNIRHAFGIPVESQVKYPGPDPHNSITSQYDRPYNLPRGVTNENLGTSL
jgi:hypothetical protein